MSLGSSMLRTPDFLENHVGMEKRVSNLETGVHPTLSDVDYFDSNAWTLINKVSSLDYWVTGFVQRLPYWRKRVGMISLRGGLQPPGGITGVWPDIPEAGPTTEAGLLLATLPSAARPPADLSMNAGITQAPYYAPVEVSSDGAMRLMEATWETSGAGEQKGVGLIFDGLMWVPND